MVLAVSFLRNRVAPVFDVSRNLLILKKNSDGKLIRKLFSIKEKGYDAKINILESNKIKTLICGAISKELFFILKSRNIKIYSFISGEIDKVIIDWEVATLEEKKSSNFDLCFRKDSGIFLKGHFQLGK